jgi:Phospholipid methyltransferase
VGCAVAARVATAATRARIHRRMVKKVIAASLAVPAMIPPAGLRLLPGWHGCHPEYVRLSRRGCMGGVENQWMSSAGVLWLVAVVAGDVADSPALTVYALSYWHYLLYWWAFRHGSVPPARFRRDAVAMKAVALLAFAWVYVPLATPAATAVAVAGFGLNALAAAALGKERTYYGWELGETSHGRVTAFPYSVVPHPMLLGNVVAFAGPLLSESFRSVWWPLALLHVLSNAALFVMETAVMPRRVRREPGGPPAGAACEALRLAVAAAVGATAGFVAAGVSRWPSGRLPCAAVAASAAAFAAHSARSYVPAPRPRLSATASVKED